MATAPKGAAPETIKSRLDTAENKLPHATRQRLVRLTAKLDALATWRDDIQARLEHAKQMQDGGVLLAVEQDDLIDAVAAWRLAASRVVLDLVADIGDVRRAA